LTGDQIVYIAKDAGVKIAIVEQDFLDTWRGIRDQLPDLETLVVLSAEAGEGEVGFVDLLARGQRSLDADRGPFDNAWHAVKPDDVATIIYTSGTTGPPKGVQLTHRNVAYMAAATREFIELRPGMRGVSYLPLAHIAERMLTHYLAMTSAGQVEYVPDVKQILPALQGTRPEIFLAVPRVWEKMQARILAALDEADDRRRKLALSAIEAGKRKVRLEQDGDKVGLLLRAQCLLFDRLVFGKVRDNLGMDEVVYAISGAAPISKDLQVFFKALGIEIIEAYGMTESTAVIATTRPGSAKFGTVGVPIPGTQVRLGEDGEVLARGPHVTPGYLNRPEATAETIDDEGWLHTGDLGRFDDQGNLEIIGRKKELIVTAGGKNLSPNNIEEAIKPRSPLIAQVCAVGDDRPFVSALVVLDAEVLPGWCEAHGVEFTSVAQASQHERVVAEVAAAIEAGNQELARVEQIRQWTILAQEWTPESEEMTPTMKLKRNVIHTKYSDVIDGMYTRPA
jgi:long-chain acyl-CoA synthetase